MSKVREDVQAGKDVRPRPLAREGGFSESTIYSWAAQGKVETRRVHGCLFIRNASARHILDLPETPAEANQRLRDLEARESARRVRTEAQAA